ncbi:DUF2157 domain-containing protein [Ornithinibacillus contaminans]|uniref:DUF2157 domain-containing protein n=1 Tax=Ornithinibacillus contaminans TaxID=694055 RepID=UPI00064DE6E8|nr:DUF2157 domain-containing protein [Ornithinibacillus contaminans]
MNKNKLKQEGEKWVREGIITDDQLGSILSRYSKKDPNFLLLLFATILTALGFITFITSDWAQIPHYSRVVLISIVFISLYLVGHYLYLKKSTLQGISFIILGYILFGIGMLLTINIYDIILTSAWPYIIWSLVGLLLYFVYEHRFMLSVGLIITTIGQIASGIEFDSFNVILFLIFLFGYLHFVYHRANYLFGYIYAVSFSIQMLVLTLVSEQEFYWLVIYFLLLYLAGEVFPKKQIHISFKYSSLISVFLLGMFQSIVLEDSFFMAELRLQYMFLPVWSVLLIAGIIMKTIRSKPLEIIDFILFLPVAFIPFSDIVGLISLFVFSVLWLIIGYRKEVPERILLATIAFLLSTFTAYIQFAWDALNKSLFFIIGGILLFVLSFLLERSRRQRLEDK